MSRSRLSIYGTPIFDLWSTFDKARHFTVNAIKECDCLVPGVYIICRWTSTGESQVLYVGRSGYVNQRLRRHLKKYYDATHFYWKEVSPYEMVLYREECELYHHFWGDKENMLANEIHPAKPAHTSDYVYCFLCGK